MNKILAFISTEEANSSPFSLLPPTTAPFKVHVSAFKASVDDVRIIIGWTSTLYQMQAAAAAAAVGGKGLNMPRGAAVKPVSRFQGPNKYIQAADTAVTSRLAPPSPPRAAARGNLTMPGERGGWGKKELFLLTTNNMSGLTPPAPPLHDNVNTTTASAACMASETLSDGEKKPSALKVLNDRICCICKNATFQ